MAAITLASASSPISPSGKGRCVTGSTARIVIPGSGTSRRFATAEDDGIGAFHWLDEGFGRAWCHADRALLFRAGGDRQPADRAGWRQSQASAGTSEGQLTDHLVASLTAHENFT